MSNENESKLNFFNNGVIPREIKLCVAAVLEGALVQFDKVPGSSDNSQTMVQFYLYRKGETPMAGGFTINAADSMAENNFRTTADVFKLGDIFNSEVKMSDEAVLSQLIENYTVNTPVSEFGLVDNNVKFIEERITKLISQCKAYPLNVSNEISLELPELYKQFTSALKNDKKKQVTTGTQEAGNLSANPA